MLTSERRAILLARLSRDGRLVATDLARELNLSEDTIRRDLRDMAADGLLARVHGGALPLSPPLPDLARRQLIATEEKSLLARAAARLVEPGMMVFVDGGSTHMALIEALPVDISLTIVTHAPGIAAALERFERIEVQLVGGTLYRHSMVAIGAACLSQISTLSPDLAFLGVTGINRTAGLTTGHIEEAAVKRSFAGRSRRVAVLATRAKIGLASPVTILPMAAMTELVLAGPVDPAHLSMAEAEGVTVIAAD